MISLSMTGRELTLVCECFPGTTSHSKVKVRISRMGELPSFMIMGTFLATHRDHIQVREASTKDSLLRQAGARQDYTIIMDV